MNKLVLMIAFAAFVAPGCERVERAPEEVPLKVTQSVPTGPALRQAGFWVETFKSAAHTYHLRECTDAQIERGTAWMTRNPSRVDCVAMPRAVAGGWNYTSKCGAPVVIEETVGTMRGDL